MKRTGERDHHLGRQLASTLAAISLLACASACSDTVEGGNAGGGNAPGIRLPDAGGHGDAGGTQAKDAGEDDVAIAPDAGMDAGSDDAELPDAGGGDDDATDAGDDASIGPDAGADADGGHDAGLDAGSDGGADAGHDAGTPDAGPDLDLDGLPDGYEAQIAADYLPIIAVHAQDKCPLGGIVYRLRPHPQNPKLIHVIYDHLYQNDCGLGGHVGDNEAFAATINPAKPPSDGVTYLKGISHQATVCQKITECGTCNNAKPCETGDDNGVTRPIVYSARDKHGSYVLVNDCNTWTCLDQCAAAPRTPVILVNAGEPDAHLTEDLTAAGLITQANGWTEQSVFNFNPWDTTKDFGTAGNIAGDLVDTAFDTPACE